MVNLKGVVVQAATSDDMFAGLCSGRFRLRHTPGPKNVLGLAKFMLPNQYELYMHATSAQWLFARARRDLSHGCIRVERPEDLAEWVLHDESGWPRDRIIKAMQGSETIAVTLKRPVQLVTTYVTAVTLENGEVHFFDDIYREDESFDKELADARRFPSTHR
jgi:murein L,D-transpeptidase YcbB/YkuD